MNSSRFVDVRKTLHQYPEISGNEGKTAAFIAEQLFSINPEFQIVSLADNSLIASIGNPNGTHIAFRCELDALPIQEINDFQHRSSIDGVSHKCGHDGHMAIMLNFANKLRGVNLDLHYISLLFQASEENGKGAKYVISHSQLFKNKTLDYIFSLHNIPGFKENEIILKEGVFTPEVKSVKFTFQGKTTHASDPSKGMNPAYLMAQMIEISKQQLELDELSADFNLITPIYARLGEESYGIAAGYAELGFTVRSWSKDLAKQTKNWLETTAQKLGVEHNIVVGFEWFDEFGSVHNESYCIQKIRAAAKHLNLEVFEKDAPMPFGEDFGLYTSVTKGAMFGIGAGIDSAALHNDHYDFNDKLIEPASDLFLETLIQIQND